MNATNVDTGRADRSTPSTATNLPVDTPSDDKELRRCIRLLGSALADSVHRRDAYLEPLNYIQVFLLPRVREIDPKHPGESRWMQPLLRTINAIAAGMRNTG